MGQIYDEIDGLIILTPLILDSEVSKIIFNSFISYSKRETKEELYI